MKIDFSLNLFNFDLSTWKRKHENFILVNFDLKRRNNFKFEFPTHWLFLTSGSVSQSRLNELSNVRIVFIFETEEIRFGWRLFENQYFSFNLRTIHATSYGQRCLSRQDDNKIVVLHFYHWQSHWRCHFCCCCCCCSFCCCWRCCFHCCCFCCLCHCVGANCSSCSIVVVVVVVVFVIIIIIVIVVVVCINSADVDDNKNCRLHLLLLLLLLLTLPTDVDFRLHFYPRLCWIVLFYKVILSL